MIADFQEDRPGNALVKTVGRRCHEKLSIDQLVPRTGLGQIELIVFGQRAHGRFGFMRAPSLAYLILRANPSTNASSDSSSSFRHAKIQGNFVLVLTRKSSVLTVKPGQVFERG